MASNEINTELESFREQWRAEVKAKVPGTKKEWQHQQERGTVIASSSVTKPARRASKAADIPRSVSKKLVQPDEVEDEYHRSQSFDEAAPSSTVSHGLDVKGKGKEEEAAEREPVSALEHYEKAVERELAGKLGDSLSLYRKAFRMDHRVDKKYKDKHFPAPLAPKAGGKPTSSSTGTQSNASNASAPVPSTTSQPQEGQPPTMKELIASFSGIAMEPKQPEIEGDPVEPCPISELPGEILVHILRDVAVLDIASFVRLARVCKRLAFLVATEDQIWRRVCLGTEFGFLGMHYRWQTGITWGALDPEEDEATDRGPPGLQQGEILDSAPTSSEPTLQDLPDLLPPTPEQRAGREAEEKEATTLALFHTAYSSSWQRMFRLRPRIRFGGCYISTVNYIRSGQASSNQSTWGSPVHIVTYYRYLRFYRDGTAISLLTTAEPADVVHHLTRANLLLHREGGGSHLPSMVMQGALKGRWRLSSAQDYPDREGSAKDKGGEGDVFVETEGVGKYLYRMDLTLKSAGRGGPRNNKLSWRGFYSYNRLTDDWAEFGLKNDKPFFFSRVRSYGLGE